MYRMTFDPIGTDLSSITLIYTLIRFGKLLFEIGTDLLRYIKKPAKNFLFTLKFSADHHDLVSIRSAVSHRYSLLRLCELLI